MIYFIKLSKATVRKTDSKPKGRGAPRRGPGAPPGGTTGRGRGSLQPRNVGQRAAAVYTPRSNQRYYADANNNLTQPQKSKKEQTYDCEYIVKRDMYVLKIHEFPTRSKSLCISKEDFSND